MTTVIGQPADLVELASRHRLGVWRYLRFLGCDDAAADDLTQETFLAVTRRPPCDLGQSALAAYLRKTAQNLFFAWARKHRRQPVTEDLELVESVWQEFARDDEGDTYIEALRGCVEELNGRARQAIELHYRDSASREQIAGQLEMTPDGVKTLLRRTRAVLRQCVERRVHLECGPPRGGSPLSYDRTAQQPAPATATPQTTTTPSEPA
jgi:RNA polymerase sigma-70 factor (ECF subfamily)